MAEPKKNKIAIAMNPPKKKATAKPSIKFKDLRSKKDPKGGEREMSVTEPPEPTFTKTT
jgi:hypothetical protein